MGLMNFHIASFWNWISYGVSDIDRFRKKPNSHLFGQEIDIKFAISSYKPLTNRIIKLRIISGLARLQKMLSSPIDLESLFNFILGDIFIKLKIRPYDIPQNSSP